MINDFDGWTLLLLRMESRQTIQYNTQGDMYRASGTFWVLTLDARNNMNSARSLGQTVDFVLADPSRRLWPELSDHGKELAWQSFARIEGREAMDTEVLPSAVTHAVLVFDVASGVSPAQLIGRILISPGKVSSSGQVWFDLTKR